MLTSFTIQRHFNKLKVTLYVDMGDHKDKRVSIMATYDRVIVLNMDLGAYEAHSILGPTEAEAWLSRLVDVPGGKLSFVESLERRYRMQAA